MSTTILIAIALFASIAMTLAVIGVAILFATSPRARAILMEIARNLPL